MALYEITPDEIHRGRIGVVAPRALAIAEEFAVPDVMCAFEEEFSGLVAAVRVWNGTHL